MDRPTPSIVCSPAKTILARLTTTAGVFTSKPLTPIICASTYAFVATSVGLVTVPSIVIIFVAKSPIPSRRTIVPGISALAMSADAISAITIGELDKVPFISVCTTPA